MNKYSTVSVSKDLVEEIIQALQSVSDYGSLEIYVQNNMVTQITVRNIKKTLSVTNGKSNHQLNP